MLQHRAAPNRFGHLRTGYASTVGQPFFRSRRCASYRADALTFTASSPVPRSSPDYSILVLRVTVPGRSKPVFVSIGLAGNGVIARTILYSLRAA